MKGSRLAKNTISSLVFQITTVICGFILPRLILQSFGSEVNGLVNSITQFLGVIAFLELGVGAVVQSSLYKPLAEHDDDLISKIMVSASKFFRKLAYILLAYIVVLLIIYPYIAEQNFGHLYTATLIAALSINSFSQYYFGVADRLLLTADQRGFIQYTAQTVTLMLNTAMCAVLIYCGASIHIVKLATSLIYLLRPIFLRWYVNKHYNINRKITYDEEPIKQKWNGVAQHIAAVVLDSTDSIVLTVFATLADVSIYSVYHLVAYGVKNLFAAITKEVQSLMGELWAKRDVKLLNTMFEWTEWLVHTGAVFVFGCTGVLIVPFVQVYTSGISDINYVQPIFAILIVIAYAVNCLRNPYNVMILAAGHYKETQSNYIVAAVLNIVISIITVKFWGLIGVAIGTLIAMLYQTVWMAFYTSRRLLVRPFVHFVKQTIVDIVVVICIYFATAWIELSEVTYLAWVVMAIKVAVIVALIVLVINCFVYPDKLKKLVLRKS